MERHPNEYWLKYMIAVSGASYKKVAETCDLYEFPKPSRAYFKRLSTQLLKTRPKPFRADSRRAKNWLRRQRIMSIARSDENADSARSFLDDWRLRPVLSALLIAKMPISEIPKYCKEITGTLPKVKAVEYFKHYFWNVDLMSPAQWYDYAEGLPPPEAAMLISCRTHGAEYALWRLGHRVAIDKMDIVNLILHESTMRFMETSRMHNDRHTALTAKLWTEQIFRAMEEQEKAGDIQHALKELKMIAIKLQRDDIPSFEDLSNEIPE